jgi:hypothetical protein
VSRDVVDIDRGYAALIRTIRDGIDTSVEVGVADDGGSPDIVMIGMVHEFGSDDGHVPERSFLRSTMDENRPKYAALIETATERVLFHGAKPENAFAKVGRTVVFDVQRRISSGDIEPALAPETIARKGSDTPLLDTGRLRSAIVFEVKRG